VQWTLSARWVAAHYEILCIRYTYNIYYGIQSFHSHRYIHRVMLNLWLTSKQRRFVPTISHSLYLYIILLCSCVTRLHLKKNEQLIKIILRYADTSMYFGWVLYHSSDITIVFAVCYVISNYSLHFYDMSKNNLLNYCQNRLSSFCSLQTYSKHIEEEF